MSAVYNMNIDFLYFWTHSARSRVGNFPSVRHPLVVGPFFVGKRPIEDHTDVSHGVDAHRRAFEHRSAGEQISTSYCKNIIKTASTLTHTPK